MIRLRIWQNGDKIWLLNKKLHRANGPTITYAFRRTCYWFWHDQEITEFEHMMLMAQEQANG